MAKTSGQGPVGPSNAGRTFESDGGIAGVHPKRSLPVFAAPAIRGDFPDLKNTVRQPLDPIACWRMNDVRFEFESSFIRPESAAELKQLSDLIEQNPAAPLSVFGHADPTGTDDFNKKLAGRRAKALYGLLTRNTDLWNDLFDTPLAGDDWKKKNAIAMIRTFVEFNQLPPVPTPALGRPLDKAARTSLFKSYMDGLCPVALTHKAFLSQGKDPTGHKGDMQGCGEFNPVLVRSARSEREHRARPTAASKLARDSENAINRRVMVYLFPPGTKMDPSAWPCPTVDEGVAGCKKRFWSDAERRRTPNENVSRLFEDARDTFTCRFYQRIAGRSPCEGRERKQLYWNIRVMRSQLKPLKQRSLVDHQFYVVTIQGKDGQPTGKRYASSTTEDGIIRIPVQEDPVTMVLKIADHTVTIDAGHLLAIEASDPKDQTIRQRLENLGYGDGPSAEWDDATFKAALKQFQIEAGVTGEDGLVGPATKDALVREHGS